MNDGQFPAWFNPQKLRPIIVSVVFRMLSGYSQSTRDMVVDDALDDVRRSYRPLPDGVAGRRPASAETFAHRVAKARAIDAFRRGPADIPRAPFGESRQEQEAQASERVDHLLISASTASALFGAVFTQHPHPPFQVVTFAAHRLLDYSLAEIVSRLSLVPLGTLWADLSGALVDGYGSIYPFPDEVSRVRRHLEVFGASLARPVVDSLTSPETLNLYRDHNAALLAQTVDRSSLADYFTVDGDAARRKQAGHWCDAVRRRSVTTLAQAMNQTGGDGAAASALRRITHET
jgi:DNA-directed RNA polymerase specialized sigma24 family protein